MGHKASCGTCGWVHPSDASIAVGRFSGDPVKYKANGVTDALLRGSRAEAERDWCAARQRPEAVA